METPQVKKTLLALLALVLVLALLLLLPLPRLCHTLPPESLPYSGPVHP